ncbi:MAG: hypothetical protein ACREXT_02365, partial [Gammaproteobacteria bacterium]
MVQVDEVGYALSVIRYRNILLGAFALACAGSFTVRAGDPSATTAPTVVEAEQWLAQALVDISSGRHTRGAQGAARAAGLAEQLGQPELVARALIAEGQALLLAGDRAQAKDRLEAAVARARAANRPDLAANAESDLGALYSLRGDTVAALHEFDASFADATAAGVEVQALRATLNRARVLRQAGQTVAAYDTVRALTPALMALPDSAQKLALLTSAGQLSVPNTHARLASPDFAAAEALLREAATLAARLGDPRGQSYALGYASELRAAAGDDAAA